MEMKKDYAVLFKKEVINGTYGILLFNPCYVDIEFYVGIIYT